MDLRKITLSSDQFRMLHNNELCDSHLLEDNRLIVEGRLACPIGQESYAGGSVNFWYVTHARQVKG
jgi:hypothetical protein